MPKLAGLFVALMVAGASLAVASEMGLPPVSEGGEFAYVREYPSDGLATAEAGEHLTATYVGFTIDEHPQRDRLLDFESRGRIADAQVFHRVDVPDGTFSDLRFEGVDHIERGIFVGVGPTACFAVLNGVNAGTSLIAKAPTEARYLVVDDFDLVEVDPSQVDITRDGHTYRFEALGNASLSVDGVNVRATLGEGGEIRGWITDEYPATTKVMHAEFDDLSCEAAADAPEPEPEPEPVGPDAAVDKDVRSLDEESVIFGMKVSNEGDQNATNVTLHDDLPEGGSEWFLGGADSEDCVLENGTLSCAFGELAPGDVRDVTAQSYIRGMCGDFPNTASVSADEDVNASNDQDTAVAPLPPCPTADVALDKEVAEANEQHVIFQIDVESVGELDASNVTLVDELPETHDPWLLGGADSEDCGLEGNTLTCAFGTLAPGEVRSVQLKSYVDEICGELSNTASVSADEDSDASNDSDTAVAQLTPCDAPDEGHADEPEEPGDETEEPAVNETEEPGNETEEPSNETEEPGNETEEPAVNETEEPADETQEPGNETEEPVPEEEPAQASACPRTQGYWKNHEEAWPVDELVLGNETYSKEEALELFDTPPKGDASLILAHQLMAARLNEAAGADTTDIQDALLDADDILSRHGRLPTGTHASSPAGQDMVALSEEIDAWNNSDCDDEIKPLAVALEYVTPGTGLALMGAGLAGLGATILVARRR